MIHATCHTADNVRCIEFDATPWFSEADAPSIIDLASTALQIPSSADEDTNACTTSLSMRRIAVGILGGPNLGNLRVRRRWTGGRG